MQWLSVYALNESSSAPQQQQPYELFADEHRVMDVERYLQVRSRGLFS